MAWPEFLAIILTGLGLTASITYYAMVLRNANKTRQTQLFMNLFTQLRSKDFVRDTRELSSGHGTTLKTSEENTVQGQTKKHLHYSTQQQISLME